MSDFAEYLFNDLLASVRGLTHRRMFGGHGIYLGGVFCAIVSGDALYIRTDARTRQDFESRGMKPFTYAPGKTLKNYYEAPAFLLEDAAELEAWLRRAAALDR